MDARAGDFRETDLIARGPAVAVRRYPTTVTHGDHQVRLGIYPVGVDTDFFDEQAGAPETAARASEIRASTGAKTLILAAERLDYVKGMLERLHAFERFLERNPEAHRNISFIQIAVPTRTGMEEFQEVRRQVEGAVGRINGQYGTMDWRPVLHFYGSFDRPELAAFYRAADMIWVTPLRDGLNLVVKEYVACRTDVDGVVVLSEFAGVAAELAGAVLVNPYSPDDMDRALEQAVSMAAPERRARMQKMRKRVLSWGVQQWAEAFLNAAGEEQDDAALQHAGTASVS
jgi:glucosylglycerol-phosphate synthase